jgi:hypothetical protein
VTTRGGGVNFIIPAHGEVDADTDDETDVDLKGSDSAGRRHIVSATCAVALTVKAP